MTEFAENPAPTPQWASKGGVLNFGPNKAEWDDSRTSDVLRIKEVYARWGMYYDECRMDLLSSLFEEDGILEIYVGSGDLAGSFVGVDKVADFLTRTIISQGDQRRHLMTNVLVERLSETEASTIAYGAVLVASQGMSLDISAVYSGDLVKGKDGVWRFCRLAIGMDSYSGSPS